jgi:hypothetical protein
MPRVRMRVDETKTDSLRRSCGGFRAGATQLPKLLIYARARAGNRKFASVLQCARFNPLWRRPMRRRGAQHHVAKAEVRVAC